MFSIIAMAALSIDVGTLYQASAEAQRAADTAALAAARMLSSSGMTGDPTNGSNTWIATCASATQLAQAVANQNLVGGAQPSGVTVTFTASDGSGCSGGQVGFGVNPMVTVKVTQANLPTYFSRIWGRTGKSVSATATAEAFNPSNSSSFATNSNVVPVQPRCVKPWMLPNLDPNPSGKCTTCRFVDPTSGTIINPGILAQGSGIIGATFWIAPDCSGGSSCAPLPAQPQANIGKTGIGIPNLQYLPGETSFPSIAVPSDGSDACKDSSSAYAQAIAGCDQSTKYQCGTSNQNVIDLGQNPVADTPSGTQCLIHQTSFGGGGGGGGGGSDGQGGGLGGGGWAASGQDSLVLSSNAPVYPLQMQIGSKNPLLGAGAGANDTVSSSNSIVTLPIYDNTKTILLTGTTSVTIVGFLQVFINYVDAAGNVLITVMNVAGCGNAASGTALTGTSPVPVRLITPPPTGP
jgi:Flp pilus assembly protein TadG